MPAGVIEDLTGKIFTRLTVGHLIGNRKVGSKGQTVRVWACTCVCGAKLEASANSLRAGYKKSCGCLQRETQRKGSTSHGFARHPLYRVHRNMMERCYNPKHKSYKDYGARGITVCPEWHSVERFIAHWGETLNGLTLERLDNTAGYHPGNCKAATFAEQARNRRSTVLIAHNGETLCLKDWAKRLQTSYSTVKYWASKGMTVGAMLDKATRGNNENT